MIVRVVPVVMAVARALGEDLVGVQVAVPGGEY
jgi:hypothetical protein